LIWASSLVQEISLEYSKCHTDAPDFPTFADMPGKYVHKSFKSNNNPKQAAPQWSKRTVDAKFYNGTHLGATVTDTVQCVLKFGIDSDMKPPVLFYYRLTNFYQNHRRYAKSFNVDQLSGKAVSTSDVHNSDCTPLTTTGGKPYYPCGLAANSLFNDTFESPVLTNPKNTSDSDGVIYLMNNSTNIAWGSDKDLYGQTKYKWEDVAVPPNWINRFPDGYSDDWHPDLVNDEHFQVWMRLAGLPTFSKLYQRNDKDTLGFGTYLININHHFDVTEYGGTKSILISTRTVIGGKNDFLGIAYVVVAGLCAVLGAVFTVTHLIKPRKLGDHTYLSWNNEGPSHATASGRDNVLPSDGAYQR